VLPLRSVGSRLDRKDRRKEQAAGMTLNSAKLVKDGDALHVTTGPAVTYWNPANKAKETTP